MYHTIQDGSPCLYCESWCEECSQCKCEIGRRRVCPGFNVKRYPKAFAKWKVRREEDRYTWYIYAVTKKYGPGSESYETAKRKKKFRESDYGRFVWAMTRKYGPGSESYESSKRRLTHDRRRARIHRGDENATQSG